MTSIKSYGVGVDLWRLGHSMLHTPYRTRRWYWRFSRREEFHWHGRASGCNVACFY
ncbi:hypothetical protein Hanom_Chr16g01484281 [Helianthus anomalus]